MKSDVMPKATYYTTITLRKLMYICNATTFRKVKKCYVDIMLYVISYDT